jgi:hypothetical protein
MVHVLGFQALVEAFHRQRVRDRRRRGEREREEEEEDVGTRRKGAQEKGERSRRGVSVVGEGEWRWGSRMRKPSECGSF